MKKVKIGSGFHHADWATFHFKTDKGGALVVSPGQLARINTHMCGAKNCICGPHHGWETVGANLSELTEAMADTGANIERDKWRKA